MASRRSAVRAALVVSAGYALLASVWIVFSDAAIAQLGPERLVLAQTVKGLGFVAVTAVALFAAVHGLFRRALAAAYREQHTLERLGRVQRLLTDANSLLVRADDETSLLVSICETAVTGGGFSGAWVGAIDRSGRLTMLASFHAEAIASLELSDQDACEDEECPVKAVLDGAERVVQNDVLATAGGARLAMARQAGMRSLAAVPVIKAGEPIAALCVFANEPDAFGSSEVVLLERLGVDLSVGLERISNRRELDDALARLKESEQRYRELFASAPKPMWVYDLETLAFLAVNDAAVAHYGYTRDEFLSMTIADIRPAEDVPVLLASIAAGDDDLELSGRWRHVTKDGRVIRVEITSHGIEWEGRRAKLVAADDLTALLEAGEELERTARRLSTLIEVAPVPVIAADTGGDVTLWNPAAERLFGWRAEEVLGQPVPVIPPDRKAEFGGAIEALRTGERVEPFHTKRVAKDGRVLDVVVHTEALRADDGPVTETMAILLDVTESKAAEAELELHRTNLEVLVQERTHELSRANEELLEATRVKSEFLASMSHELRTPLNSVIGFSGILLKGLAGSLNEEQLMQVTMINRSGKHLLSLINDVLDLSKIEAGQFDIQAEPFDVRRVVETIVATLGTEAAEKGLVLTVTPAADDTSITSDPVKVRQILFNLVGNAIKFTAEGTVTVSVQANHATVTVAVVDTGPGIAPREHGLVFEEFHQSAHSANVKPAGTGLGLTISRRLARALGGEVALSSDGRSGSTFTLTLPRVHASPVQDVM